ncbi:MAG: hypothetical protein V4654_08185 [Bdellovibrionota bacterium]
MKLFFAFLSLSFLCSQSFGEAPRYSETLKTVVTCQQSDGDHWLEVGVTKQDANVLKLLLVMHNDDDGSAKLIYEQAVELSKRTSTKAIFHDVRNTVVLAIDLKTLVANFKLEEPGPNEVIMAENLKCYLNSDITFERAIELEPRMSVGN